MYKITVIVVYKITVIIVYKITVIVVYKITVTNSRELIRTDSYIPGVKDLRWYVFFDIFYQVNMQLGVHVVCHLLRIF